MTDGTVEEGEGFTDASSALIGIHQLGFEGVYQEDEIARRTRQMLARALNMHALVGFVGSGISQAYGYPSWDKFAAEIVRFTLGAVDVFIDDPTRQLLLSYGAHVRDSQSPLRGPDRTLNILAICGDIFERAGDAQNRRLKNHIGQQFIPSTRSVPPDRDPLRLVMQRLEVRRFVTINYDLEIERAFVRVMRYAPSALGLESLDSPLDPDPASSAPWRGPRGPVGPSACSLSFPSDSDDVEGLLQFAVMAPGYEHGVLHLHGRADRPSSLVVTERDYQRVYLRDDPVHRSHREALELAFSGNAILFMGVGLEESDLLRPLRQFVSEGRGGKERPLFALYPELRTEADRIEFRRYLHSRFGVKVLYFPVVDDDKLGSFCAAVDRLGSTWRSWWRSWQRTPVIRTPVFGIKDGAMLRHQATPPAPHFPVDGRRKLSEALTPEKGAGVILLGRAGTGKGSLGLDFVQNPRQEYERRYFATAHFTNDLLSMLDAAADFLGGGDALEGEALDRLEHALSKGRHLLVLGGIERLLSIEGPSFSRLPSMCPLGPGALDERDPLPAGRPTTQEVQRLLELVDRIAGSNGSHIVLTSSIDPRFLGKNLRRIPIEGVSEEDALRHPHFKGIDPDLALELYRATRGHAYVLSVIGQMLQVLGTRAGEAWLDQLLVRLTAMDLVRRPEKVAEAVLRAHLDASPDQARFIEGLLQRVALFTTPITPDDLRASYPEGQASEPDTTGALSALEEARLVLKVDRVSQTSEQLPPRYTAHTVVRAHVLHRLGALPDTPGEAHTFRLSGFSTDEPELHPGSAEGHHLVASSVDALLQAVDRREGSGREHRDLIRATFGVIRSRWTATSVGRLGWPQATDAPDGQRSYYDAYQRRLALLLNAIRRADPDSHKRDRRVADTVVHRDGILYADELAWLYNELGLVALSQGSVLDAYALFRKCQHVCGRAERGARGHRWCQAQINLAHVQIERGRLVRAGYHLTNALEGAQALRDQDLEAQAAGYSGLLHHLSGEYVSAETHYSHAIGLAQTRGNRRAASIFMRHRSDLHRRRGSSDKATEDIQGSIAMAESGRHPDLLYFARIAESHALMAQGETASMERAVDFARRVGLPKLEVEAYAVETHIALKQEDSEFASRRAREALAIAQGLHMGLRVTSTLVLAGRVASLRRRTKAARSLFQAAIALGEWQGYQMQIENAEQQLMRLPDVYV